MRNRDSHEEIEENQTDAQRNAPLRQPPVSRETARQSGVRLSLKEGPLEHLRCLEIWERIGQERLGHQNQINDSLELLGGQIIGDFLQIRKQVRHLRVRRVLNESASNLLSKIPTSQKTEQAEKPLEHRGGQMTPLEHLAELSSIDHGAFKGWQEDVGCVGENNDAQHCGEGVDIQAPTDFTPHPMANSRQTKDQHDHVDHHVRHSIPEGKPTDRPEGSEKSATEQQGRTENHPTTLKTTKK